MKTPDGYEHFGEIDGAFDTLPDEAKERVKIVVDQFTVKNKFKHRDGSKGFVKVSPKQFGDILVWFVNGMIEQYSIAVNGINNDEQIEHRASTL